MQPAYSCLHSRIIIRSVIGFSDNFFIGFNPPVADPAGSVCCHTNRKHQQGMVAKFISAIGSSKAGCWAANKMDIVHAAEAKCQDFAGAGGTATNEEYNGRLPALKRNAGTAQLAAWHPALAGSTLPVADRDSFIAIYKKAQAVLLQQGAQSGDHRPAVTTIIIAEVDDPLPPSLPVEAPYNFLQAVGKSGTQRFIAAMEAGYVQVSDTGFCEVPF